MNFTRSNILSLTYQSFAEPDCKDIGIIKLEFVAKVVYVCYFYFWLLKNFELYFYDPIFVVFSTHYAPLFTFIQSLEYLLAVSCVYLQYPV